MRKKIILNNETGRLIKRIDITYKSMIYSSVNTKQSYKFFV